MHASHDNDLILNNAVEKAVRETTQVYTACLTVNNREPFRVCPQRFNDGTHRCKKLVTKTGLLSPHTIDRRLLRLQRPQGGRSVASPGLRSDLLQDLVPRNTLR